MSASENQPPIRQRPAPGEKPKAGTELTYQQLEEELTKNTKQVMDACKQAIAASTRKSSLRLKPRFKQPLRPLFLSLDRMGKAR